MATDDPFEVLATPVPDVGPDTVAAVLAGHYGLDGVVEPLDSERDRNFLVTTGRGRFVLKFANAAEDPAVADFQCRALLHIERSAPGLPVPRVVPTRDGDLTASHRSRDATSHRVRLLTYLDGTGMSASTPEADVAATLGSLLAKLGRALADFEHPGADHALLWDLKQAAHLRALLDCVDNAELRALCRDRLDVFDSDVAPALDTLRRQVIHSDMNPGNVLVDATDASRVTGIIDFGDMVRSPLVADVAIACAYLLKADADPFDDPCRFVAAYHSLYALQLEEIELLYDLILTRSAMTILISRWRAARYPENRGYILRSERLARERLESASAFARTDVTRGFVRACGAH